MVEKVEKEKLPFLVYARRIMKNPLLNRKQMVGEGREGVGD